MRTATSFILVLALCVVVGCRSSMPPESIQQVRIDYYNPFSPEDGQKPQSFDLSEDELAEFRTLCPDLSKTNGPGCDAVFPQFFFTVHYQDGRSVRAQLCHSIRTYDPDGTLDAPPGLEPFLIEAIRARAGKLEWGTDGNGA